MSDRSSQEAGGCANRSAVAAAEALLARLAGLRPDAETAMLAEIEALGADLFADAALSARLGLASLGAQAEAFDLEGQSGYAPFAAALSALREEAAALDPHRLDGDGVSWLGRLWAPFQGDPIERYFAAFEARQAALGEALRGLEAAEALLRRDRLTLSEDAAALAVGRDEAEAALALCEALGPRLAAAAGGALADRAAFVRGALDDALTRRVADLRTHRLALEQSALAAEITLTRLGELIRAAEHAQSVMLTALRTAAATAMTVAKRRLSLEAIGGLAGAAPTPESEDGDPLGALKASFADLDRAMSAAERESGETGGAPP